IVNAEDRIPEPELIGGRIYNFWQDAAHVRGLWRRTSRLSFANAKPRWTSVLDLDQLAKQEGADWVWKGANCPPPYERCLIALSDGGEDAVRLREFDLIHRRFVPGGFDLPKSKQNVEWLGPDELLVSRDWGPGTMTASGYPFVVKILKRGEPLSEAREIFRGEPSDVGAGPQVFYDEKGRATALLWREVNFFTSEWRLLTPHGLVELPLPGKVEVEGVAADRLIVLTRQDWRPAPKAARIAAGSLIALDLVKIADGGSLAPEVLFTPTARKAVEQVAISGSRVAAVITDNIRGGLEIVARNGDGWRAGTLPVAANSTVRIAAAEPDSEKFYYTVENFLSPTALFSVDDRSGEENLVKALPPRFDSSGLGVDQLEARSSDGVEIPYFVVHAKNWRLDGRNPTLLYAYGGFAISMLPAYSPPLGKLWLENGGVYVLANIRGGGEFGPAWHDAGLKTHRQIVFDDFAAVARDLIDRGITSPKRLAVQGGSNGGLLMGVEMEQHPDLFGAVLIEVPLLDMLRYEKLGAGSSWVAEYGSMSVPAEAAFLKKISPYQNLKAGVSYPEPFFVTATSDDRVTPFHARKMAARMAQMGLPFLFFENTSGGHSASANLQERAQRQALEYTYLAEKVMD
ncbi:MAG: prolyl oligopeptidase family serine peptidase, partial [Caulobacteraceae bacterium]